MKYTEQQLQDICALWEEDAVVTWAQVAAIYNKCHNATKSHDNLRQAYARFKKGGGVYIIGTRSERDHALNLNRDWVRAAMKTRFTPLSMEKNE